jgi:tetratricopeptide (TPR) repeat protein
MTEFQQANRLMVANDYAKAIELFVRHARSNPSEAAQAYAGAAECCLRSNTLEQPRPVAPGVTLVSQGNQEGAERYFRLALDADPNNLKSLWGLAQLLPDASEDRRALLERCVEVQAGTLNLIALGDYYRTHRKDYGRAYDLYERAQQHAPRDQTAYLRLNDICRRLGWPDEAKEWGRRWQQAKQTKRRVDGEG